MRAFVRQHLSPEARKDPNFLANWLRAVREKRWVGFNWPVEYGGGGGGIMEQVILKEEMSKAGAPPLGTSMMGLQWVGPALIEYGTEEQKKKFLPDILDSKYQWCTGYSEPGSGSDLASLQCRAVTRRRRVCRQRPEDLDVRRGVLEVDHLAHADRLRCGGQAQRHHVPPGGDGLAGDRGQADQEHGR